VKKVVVTGASGFVGRSVVAALRLRGYEVHGVARGPANDVEIDAWHPTDLLDPVATRELMGTIRASHLVHLAWTTAHGRFWSDPDNLAWSRATLALAEAFVDAGGGRAVMSGTCAQYGWDATTTGVFPETGERRPQTLYGISKQSTSDLLQAWSAEVGLSFATGLLFFPYGPYENPDRLVPSVTRSLLGGRRAEVRSGARVADFIYVEDCGAALAALLDSDVAGSVNIGTGQGIPVADVANAIAAALGREDLVQVVAPGTEPPIVADVTRLLGEVGFSARYELARGVRETIEWWRSQELTGSAAGSRPARR
jgi:nucleoside-diphosphate-sugar epimerase